MAAMFIRVDLADSLQQDAELCVHVAEVCPVDIFTVADGGQLETVEDNLDECTLCDLCIDAAPGQVKVVKLYRE